MNSRQSHLILRPIISEKTIALAGMNQYTFEVPKHSTKVEISQALAQILSELYPKNKTKIIKVNTAPIRGRFRRSKRHGRSPADSKKAIVWTEGDPLELFSQ